MKLKILIIKQGQKSYKKKKEKEVAIDSLYNFF